MGGPARFYDVVVIRIADNRVVSTVGRTLTDRQAEKRIRSVLHRINKDDYFVTKIKLNVGRSFVKATK